MPAYNDLYWTAPDGLRLHARDYAGDAARPAVICLPGLTRNARDFAELAERLAGPRRVLAVNLRGRGGSDHAKEPASYVPDTYVSDVQALLADQAIGRFVAIGTSLGGIVTMLLAAAGAPLAGALLNDVGPQIEPAGLARIRGYVGKSATYPTWMHAARATAEMFGDAHPGWTIADWLAMAKRLYRLNSAGRIVLDYDMRIAEPLRIAEAEPDAAAAMWTAFESLRSVPTLIVRGGLSDVLAATTAERMATLLDRGELVTVPGVGHAPTLTEAELQAPIDRLIERAGAER